MLTNCGKEVDSIGARLLSAVLESHKKPEPAKAEMPTAARILDRFVKATGGIKGYESLRTIVTHGKGTYRAVPVDVTEHRTAASQYYGTISNKKMAHIQATDGAVA